MEANINTVSTAKTQERSAAQKQDKIALHPNATQINFAGGEVNVPFKGFHDTYQPYKKPDIYMLHPKAYSEPSQASAWSVLRK